MVIDVATIAVLDVISYVILKGICGMVGMVNSEELTRFFFESKNSLVAGYPDVPIAVVRDAIDGMCPLRNDMQLIVLDVKKLMIKIVPIYSPIGCFA